VAPRYRCSACGNLTRFDVVTSRRTRAFHHYTVGGDLRIEDETVLDESIDEVTCRWCGTGTAVDVVDEVAAGAAAGVAGSGSGATVSAAGGAAAEGPEAS
jgi:hypothetical protein